MIKFFRHIRLQLLSENPPTGRAGKFSKYLLYAFGEIILVVIGILIALQVNNWNETRLEEKKVKHYVKSLIEDLNGDISMMTESQSQALKKFKYIDSLRIHITQTPYSELSNTFLYVIAHDIMYKPYNWNRSTFNELKSSGGLSYITNDSLKKKIVAYESFSNHLDEDFEFDKSNADKMDNITTSLIDLNSPYLTKLLERENYDARSNLFETEEYKLSIINDLELISLDKTLIKKFVNTLILIQDNYRVRAYKEMPAIIEDANVLLKHLKAEYKL